MPSVINSDDGVSSGTAGLKTSGSNDGITVFQQNGTESARITAAGNVGIGTSSPEVKLDVAGDILINNNSYLYGENSVGSNSKLIGRASDDTLYVGDSAYNNPTVIQTGNNYVVINTNGTERMRIDSSGNVGIGTSSPTYKLHVANTATNALGVFRDLDVTSVGAASTNIELGARNGATFTPGGQITGVLDNPATTGYLAFSTRSSNTLTERMRIDTSGNLMVGTTSSGNPNPGIKMAPGFNAQIVVGHDSSSGSGQYYMPFYWNGSLIGGITQNGTTAVAYNTTSDYRLKENVQPMTGALARVAALRPVTYTWKAAPEEIGEGFIAHELAQVCQQAVTGEKDAVDAEGNPVYQGIDTSFLVATLTAAIQELKAELDATKAEVAALKARTT